MTAPADLIVTNAEIRTLANPGESVEAFAVRDGKVIRLGTDYDIQFLADAETETLDLDGRVVVPGFIDAHTHLTTVGKYQVHADLSKADSLPAAVDRLRTRASEVDEGPVLGYGYDESRWPESRYLTREDLDAISTAQPVVAFREDMHVASVNSVVLEQYRTGMPAEDVRKEDDTPTGVIVETAVETVTEAFEPGPQETRDQVKAACEVAAERGVTTVHDIVRQSHAPEVYRELDLADELTLRVRVNYWSDHLDALIELGDRTNHGSSMVQTGAVKTFSDGSFGGRTAKLSERYADIGPDEASRSAEVPGDGTGQWVVSPSELRELVGRADEHGFQVMVHAIGDEAVEETLAAFAQCDTPGESRHRVEHSELASDAAIQRFADLGVVASMQPNFLKWAQEDGLYESRLGSRRTETNRFPAYRDAGVPLAFGSDCMPLDPLLGIHHAVNAPTEGQRLEVTEALRAYTIGAAYAGFDDDRLGTLEPGKRADFVALDRSPWDYPDGIRDIEVVLTAVDGTVVYDER